MVTFAEVTEVKKDEQSANEDIVTLEDFTATDPVDDGWRMDSKLLNDPKEHRADSGKTRPAQIQWIKTSMRTT